MRNLCRSFCPLIVTLCVVANTAAAAGLEGSEWRPTRLGGLTISQDTKLWVQFKASGELAGNGGCNQFFGTYRITEKAIDVGPLGSTRMSCPNNTMDLEAAFFSALQSAQSFQRDRAVLILFDKNENELARLAQTDWN